MILEILFKPFGLLAPKTFKIIWFSNLSTLSVPDEGDSRNVSCTINLLSMFLFLIFKNNIYSLPFTVFCDIQTQGSFTISMINKQHIFFKFYIKQSLIIVQTI